MAGRNMIWVKDFKRWEKKEKMKRKLNSIKNSMKKYNKLDKNTWTIPAQG